jgi:hypothetical protein
VPNCSVAASRRAFVPDFRASVIASEKATSHSTGRLAIVRQSATTGEAGLRWVLECL